MRITDDYVFFFSHKDVFSNWYIAPFTETEPSYNQTFNCVEQYMMWRKALLFNDHNTAQAILTHSLIRKDEKIQAYYKRMGRAVSDFDNNVWEENRERIVMRGLCLKYVQNPDLYADLHLYQYKTFVEASPYDKVYGIGMGMYEPGVLNPANWKGQNLLGKYHNKLIEIFFPDKIPQRRYL